MLRLASVLCAVDFGDLSAREVDLAAQLCDVLGARLVLHHNIAAVPPGLTRAWEWERIHRQHEGNRVEAERRLRACMAALPRTFAIEACITTGALIPNILEVAGRLPADLIVLASHRHSTEDHASVGERLIARALYPILTVDTTPDAPAVHLRTQSGEPPLEVLVPTDLSTASAAVCSYAFDLARALGLQLHLLHVERNHPTPHRHDAACRMLRELVPPDLVGRVDGSLASGDPIERIVSFASERRPAFTVMGEHARNPVTRLFFNGDTPRAALHRLLGTVWFVPARSLT